MTEEQIAILSNPEFVKATKQASIPRAVGEVIKRVNRRSYGEGVFLFRYYDNWCTGQNPDPVGVRMSTNVAGGAVHAVVQTHDTADGPRWVAKVTNWRVEDSAVEVGTFDNLCDALLASWGVVALTFPSEQ